MRVFFCRFFRQSRFFEQFCYFFGSFFARDFQVSRQNFFYVPPYCEYRSEGVQRALRYESEFFPPIFSEFGFLCAQYVHTAIEYFSAYEGALGQESESGGDYGAFSAA